MKKIIKGKEPHSLKKHRTATHSDYENYSDKDDLRKSLVAEQRGICCYCMGRIQADENRMKIEHFHSQSLFPAEQLVYNNLFGACLGNMKSGGNLHCDTLKGNEEFHFHMCDSGNIHSDIKYTNKGEIYSDNKILNFEIGGEKEVNSDKFKPGILNLNLPDLVKNRKKTLDGFKDYLTLTNANSKLNKDKVKRFREKWIGNSNSNELEPYCMIVVYYLEKKLATYK